MPQLRTNAGLQDEEDKRKSIHRPEIMSRNSSAVPTRIIQNMSQAEKKSLPNHRLPNDCPLIGSPRLQVPSSLILTRKRRSRLPQNAKKITIAPASFTAALEMGTKTKLNMQQIRSTNTGTDMDEVTFHPAKRLKKTVSFVTNLCDLDQCREKLNFNEDVTTLTSQFAECSVARKPTTAVALTPILSEAIPIQTSGSAPDTSATHATAQALHWTAVSHLPIF